MIISPTQEIISEKFENAVDDKLGKNGILRHTANPREIQKRERMPMEIKACDCRNGETSMGNTTCDIK